MPTPSIQTLVTDAQQVLNLDSISAVRSVVAVALANANTGTPLNPNLTTQQLWNEFYQVVNKPKSDIESIIANQLMKLLYAPPAPGGVGADQQVIFNDGGVLAGDPQFLWNKTTNLLTVTGAATITGDLTVDTSTLKVDSTNNRVGVRTATPRSPYALDVLGNLALGDSTTTSGVRLKIDGAGTAGNIPAILFASAGVSKAFFGLSGAFLGDTSTDAFIGTDAAGAAIRFYVSDTGTEAMRLNSTGLGVGVAPTNTFHVKGPSGTVTIKIEAITDGSLGFIGAASGMIGGAPANNLAIRAENGLYLSGGGNAIQFILNSSGNVGVGITPSAWATSTTIWRALDMQYSCGLASSGAGSGEIDLLWNAYYDQTDQRWEFKYTGDRASRYSIGGAGVHTWYNTASTGTANNPITWNPAMTLDASGNLLVGTTAPLAAWATRLTLSTNTGTTKWAVGPYADPNNFIISADGSFGVYLNGTSAVSWTGISDERLKDIIEPISNAVAKVGKLRSVIGKFKADETNTRRSFLLAQDVQAVLPEAVDASNPDRLGVAYTDVIPLLVAAIKELTARVQTLEAR